jgi:subtilase family serine protease
MRHAATALALGLLLALPVASQEHGKSEIYIPDSSIENPGDAGERAHTHFRIVINPEGGLGPGGGMTPAQLRSIYGLSTVEPLSGVKNAIAIVGAFDYSTALADFNAFSKYFKLPVETSTSATNPSNTVFQVVYAKGVQPRKNTGWSQESALDIEWSHAMAPNAKIYLVEAASNSYADLFKAVDVAKGLSGVRQVSMSWGGGEFTGQIAYDDHFNSDSVMFFASSGDQGGVVSYPSSSTLVVSVGGTSVATDSTGVFTDETGWSGSGGGASTVELRPSWQGGLPSGTARVVPDISLDADPKTGVAVFYNRFWYVFGGTSVSSPCMAGIVNASGTTATSTTQLLTNVYSHLGNASLLRDITSGAAGSFSCSASWDFVTGCGAPLGPGVFKP